MVRTATLPTSLRWTRFASRTFTLHWREAEINNWRWFGGPIFLRAGKALLAKVIDVLLFLRNVPGLAFWSNRRQAELNQIVLRIDSDSSYAPAASRLTGRLVARCSPKNFSFAVGLGEPVRPYERLLYAGLTDDRQLFAREDGIEEMWSIVTLLLAM